jgi:hypothetical protein
MYLLCLNISEVVRLNMTATEFFCRFSSPTLKTNFLAVLIKGILLFITLMIFYLQSLQMDKDTWWDFISMLMCIRWPMPQLNFPSN